MEAGKYNRHTGKTGSYSLGLILTRLQIVARRNRQLNKEINGRNCYPKKALCFPLFLGLPAIRKLLPSVVGSYDIEGAGLFRINDLLNSAVD